MDKITCTLKDEPGTICHDTYKVLVVNVGGREVTLRMPCYGEDPESVAAAEGMMQAICSKLNG